MADRYIPEHRRTTFKAKNTFKPDELRRRREEQQVEIRKQKREENLAKRRGIAPREGGGPGASLGAAPDSDDEGGNIESQVRHTPLPSRHTAQLGAAAAGAVALRRRRSCCLSLRLLLPLFPRLIVAGRTGHFLILIHQHEPRQAL